MTKAEVKRCKYHCDYGDGEFCYYEGPGECVNNYNIPQKKPPIGCKPYYVAISERIGELCEAIRRCAGEKEKHNQVKLWVNEIHLLNEIDRILRRVEAEKTWIEEKDGTLKEVE